MRRPVFLMLVILSMVFLLAGNFYALGQRPEKKVAENEEEAPVSGEDIIKAGLDDLIDVYYNEDIDKFLSYFSADEYPDFTTFEENMEATFDNNNDLVLSLTYLNTVIDGNEAVVKVDWQKSWDDSSSATGSGNTIRFKKIEGRWKIVDLENSSMFTVGTGTVSGSVTDL